MFTEPKISLFSERPYVGIRVKAPFKGMFAVVDKLLKELRAWVKTHGIADEGPFFLHRVDHWDDEDGDAFACRYEVYLTDYRVEPRKSAWEVELAIKVADDA